MNEGIGILDLDYLVSKSEGDGILDLLRDTLAPQVEVLDRKATALELLEFIEQHKRLIILERDTSDHAKETTYGEVVYWGQMTGGIPEEIVIINTDSVQESIKSVLDCLASWGEVSPEVINYH
jgi:hypothetical protein